MSDYTKCPRCGVGNTLRQGPSYVDFKCGSYIIKESGEFCGECTPTNEIDQLREQLEQVTTQREWYKLKYDKICLERDGLADDLGNSLKAVEQGTKERDEARAELADIRDAMKSAENPHLDEVHCSCVPLLRASLKEARDIWHVAENEMWMGDLREQIATARSQRDRAMELIADVCEFGDNDASHKKADELVKEITKEKEAQG